MEKIRLYFNHPLFEIFAQKYFNEIAYLKYFPYTDAELSIVSSQEVLRDIELNNHGSGWENMDRQ